MSSEQPTEQEIRTYREQWSGYMAPASTWERRAISSLLRIIDDLRAAPSGDQGADVELLPREGHDPIDTPTAPREVEVVDLVGALRDSVEAAKRRRAEAIAHDDGTGLHRLDASTTGVG